MNKRTFYLPILFIIFFSGFLFSFSVCYAAQEVWSAHVFYADKADGNKTVAGIRISLADGYYTYSHYGNGEMPTKVTLRTADGQPAAGQILYPQGDLRTDIFEPDKQILAYSGDFFIFILPESLPDSRSFTVDLSFLACSSRNCVPIKDRLLLSFPAALPPLDSMDWKETFQNLSSPTVSQRPIQSVPDTVDAIPPSEKVSWNFSPRYAQNTLEPTALGMALLLGFLAGLVLNVMPCVLPVLTMKLSTLLTASSHADAQIRLTHFREHNLLFAAGILTWFLVLSLCIGVFGLAWGGLFQDSRVVFGLLLLVFLLALSLFDVFTLPVLDFKIGASGTPHLQAYLTGLVATLLATPCSGPLLGGVLGWVALQPLPIIVIVFISTGLGMAFPYFLLALYPGAAKILPRPGAWTGIMECIVGFFLMGTCLYLLTILPEELHLKTLVVLLVASFVAWIWGHWGSIHSSGWRKVLIATSAAIMLGGSICWTFAPQPAAAPWTPFSVALFRSLWQKEPLFVEFTADWCPSCKVLEHTVLTPARLQKLRNLYGVHLIKVDLTHPDPEAEALLRALGSVSIPVAAIFPSGTLADQPVVLRDLYTERQLEQAFDTLLPRKK